VIFRGETLIESTATCHTIAEAFDSPKLWIARGEPERTAYLFWLAVFGETLEGRLVECAVSKAGRLPPELFTIHEPRVRFKLGVAASKLPKNGYLCGDKFTIADIVAGYSLRLGIGTGLVDRAAVEPYLGRLIAREASRTARFFGGL